MTPGGGGSLVIRRRIRATREELFNEWTDPENMRVWMCPGNIVSAEVHMDFRIGGSFRIIMRDPNRSYEHRGEFTIIDPPAKLAFTWIADATDHQPTLVTVEFFTLSPTESELVLTHDKFPRTEIRDRYRGGWGLIIDRLEQRLQSKN